MNPANITDDKHTMPLGYMSLPDKKIFLYGLWFLFLTLHKIPIGVGNATHGRDEVIV